jgi:phospholipid/cholesterol/gamma-HCH transport system substrate-binding protein
VGNIGAVILKEDGKVEVDINIERKSVKFIPRNARARLSTDGLIGNKIIEIFGGTPGTTSIEDGDTVASEEQVNTDKMMKTLSKNNDNLYGITSNIKIITDRLVDGKGSLGQLLTDRTLSDRLNQVMKNLQAASDHINRITANVAQYTAQFNEKGTLANDLVSDTLIFASLRQTMNRLSTVADSSQAVIENLQGATRSVNNGLDNPKSPLGMMLKDEKSASQIKLTLGNLESASKKLDEDLEALQHNFLLRRYFKKKAKKARADSTAPQP